jgi:hypothetical protein
MVKKGLAGLAAAAKLRQLERQVKDLRQRLRVQEERRFSSS